MIISTGASAAAQVGVVTVQIGNSLSGSSASGQAGDVFVASTVILANTSAAAQVSVVTVRTGNSLSGNSAIGQAANLPPLLRAGVSAAAQIGAVGFSINDLTDGILALGGISTDGQAADLAGQTVPLPDGAESAGQSGDVLLAIEQPLSDVAANGVADAPRPRVLRSLAGTGTVIGRGAAGALQRDLTPAGASGIGVVNDTAGFGQSARAVFATGKVGTIGLLLFGVFGRGLTTAVVPSSSLSRVLSSVSAATAAGIETANVIAIAQGVTALGAIGTKSINVQIPLDSVFGSAAVGPLSFIAAIIDLQPQISITT